MTRRMFFRVPLAMTAAIIPLAILPKHPNEGASVTLWNEDKIESYIYGVATETIRAGDLVKVQTRGRANVRIMCQGDKR